MLNNKFRIWLNWGTNQWWFDTIWWIDHPNGVVNHFRVKCNFTVSWKSGKYLWSYLSWMKVKWLVENIWVSYETELFTIMNNIITSLCIGFLKIKNWSSAWWSNLLGCCASVGFISWNNCITDVENQLSISSLVHHHNVITESQFSILTKCMRYSSICLRESFLNFVNDQLSLIFVIKVISLTVLG